jgi:hypothetical protein
MTINQIVDKPANPLVTSTHKRPYVAPRLIVHGTVAELTQAKLVNRPFAATYLAAM